MSTPNFSEIAARVAAGSDDVRACLIVSQDGLTLGVFPDEGEAPARAAWGRIVSGGDPEPERGFLTVGEETWAFTRRGGYGALATAGRGVRPGLLLDALDGALREAHQERVEALPAAAPARRASEPATRSRSPVPEPRKSRSAPRPAVRQLDPEALDSLDVVEVVEGQEAEPEPQEEPVAPPAPAPAARRPAPASRRAAPEPAREPAPAPSGPPRPQPAIPRVDTVELTREFGGLFDGPGGR